MSKLDIKLENIGGLKKLETSFDLGKLNIVRGLHPLGNHPCYCIHLGVVGSVPLQDLYTDEISALHLNDRNSDQALLHRGAQQGTVELSSPSGGFKSTILETEKYAQQVRIQKDSSRRCCHPSPKLKFTNECSIQPLMSPTISSGLLMISVMQVNTKPGTICWLVWSKS